MIFLARLIQSISRPRNILFPSGLLFFLFFLLLLLFLCASETVAEQVVGLGLAKSAVARTVSCVGRRPHHLHA